MTESNVEKIIREYLSCVIHLSLATSIDNKPWICEVHFVFDADLNLYFRSKTDQRHSHEIAHNNRVAGNIVEQHAVGQRVRGVYFEGIAELLENVDENHPAYTLYCERFQTDTAILEEAKEKDGHQFYRISVETFYLFDERESSPSQKYELPWSR